MTERKSPITPTVEAALTDLFAQSKASRLSKGLRSLLLEYFLMLSWERPYWFLELVEDLLPLFTFFDLTEQYLDQFYLFRDPEDNSTN